MAKNKEARKAYLKKRLDDLIRKELRLSARNEYLLSFKEKEMSKKQQKIKEVKKEINTVLSKIRRKEGKNTYNSD